MVAGALIGAGVGAAAGALGGVLQSRAATKNRRRQRRAINEARQFADKTFENLQGEGSPFALARSFLTRTFEGGGNNPLVEDFAKGIRAQQSSRGTFSGNAGALAESFGRSSVAERLRGQLVGTAENFGLSSLAAKQQFTQNDAVLRTAAATGASFGGLGPGTLDGGQFGSAIGGAIQGGFGGANLGLGIEGRQARQNQGRRTGGDLGGNAPDPKILELLEAFNRPLIG